MIVSMYHVCCRHDGAEQKADDLDQAAKSLGNHNGRRGEAAIDVLGQR